MLRLLLPLVLSTSTAQAARNLDNAPPPQAGGSLWDYIEAPTPPSDSDAHDVQTSRGPTQDLLAARLSESAYVDRAAELARPPMGFYKDPVEALEADPLHLREFDATEFDIPVVVNDDVIRWMKYFTGRGRSWYGKWLGRSGKYWPMMFEKLDAAGAPRDLVFLSMIESGYATHAYSSAAAVGLWQFIASTGRMYKLRVDWWVDERRNPELATDAAIGYLTDLHKQYGDWYLAWAAYNAGPGRVNRGIRNHKTRDFWTMVKKGSFRTETDNYVPKLLAAAIIGKHPERYGFEGIVRQDPMEHETVTVPANVGIDVLAKCAGVTVDDFRSLNPHLRRWALPPSPARQVVHVPTKRSKKFLAALDKIPPDQRITHRRHKVRKGETLAKIAGKYSVSVHAIQSVNRIRDANRISVGQTLVIPVAGQPSSQTTLTSSAGGAATKRKRATSHVVRKGETLSQIAEKYKVKTSDLIRWNGLRSANRIRVGQKLKLGGTKAARASTWTRYTVRRGDTLSTIARRQGCSIAQLKQWNGLRSSRIMAGQKLKVKRK
jgi:membrane-bound lytic murein transglycosylase D